MRSCMQKRVSQTEEREVELDGHTQVAFALRVGQVGNRVTTSYNTSDECNYINTVVPTFQGCKGGF